MRASSNRTPFFFLVATSLLSSAALAQVADVGLSSVRAQRFGRPDLPNANAGGHDNFGFALAAGDFNGDGADDLAVGVPFSDGSTATPVDECGAVVVRYGVPGKGLSTSVAPSVFGQFTPGSPQTPQASDWFGRALAACNLNGDPYDDLVVGVPGEAVTVSATTFEDAGRIAVYYGSPSGLAAIPSATFIERHYPGELNLPAANAFFGISLACGNFDGNAFDDLAVGAPNRNLPTGAVDGGRVNIFPGTGSGIGAGAFPLDQDATGIEDQGETGDLFGWALAAGDFDGNGSDDLAVGVIGENDAANLESSAVHLLYGDSQGAATGGNQLYFESSFGGTNESQDHFGWSLAAGDFDADGFDDLAAGVPAKAVGAFQAGLFYEALGSVLGLDDAGATGFDQGTLYGPAQNELDDQFGFALAAADFDGDGTDDLAVGHPHENVLQNFDGAVTIIMGQGGTGLDPIPNRVRRLEHGFQGIPGSNIEGNLLFGQTLAAGDFDGDGYADLAIGTPLESESALPGVGTVAVLYGSLFADGFEGSNAGFWSDTVP